MAMVTKSTTIGEVLARDINTAQFFINIGMHCLGCRIRRVRASKKHAWCMAQMQISW